MNAFSDAFAKVGICRPTKEEFGSKQTDEGRRFDQFNAKFLSDAEVIQEFDERNSSIEDITRQLDDHLAEGGNQNDPWRVRALAARRSAARAAGLLRTEGRRRGLLVFGDAQATQVRQRDIEAEIALKKQETKRLALEIEKARIDAKVGAAILHSSHAGSARTALTFEQKQALAILHNRQDKQACHLFVQACRQLHSKDSVARIWRRARQMFPDANCWADDAELRVVASDMSPHEIQEMLRT